MCFQNSLKKIIAFSAAFLMGILAFSVYKTSDLGIFKNSKFADKQPKEFKTENEKNGTGSSGSDSGLTENTENITSNNLKLVKVLYKPHPIYTEEARLNNIEGNVRVRVTFMANGEIGTITEVAGLPFGLTEKAIEAARKMKFEPQTENNKPVTVTKVVVFRFEI